MTAARRRPLEPPSAALRLLARRLPVDERDVVTGDLVEAFADRVDAGRRFNRLWFWCQAMVFLFGWRSTLFPDRRGRFLMTGRIVASIRQTIRRLAFEWRYAVGIVALLAIGIGPASAMLSVVHEVLMRPLAYRDSARLGLVRLELGQIHNHPGLSLSEILDLRKLDDVFEGVEGEARSAEVSLGPPNDLQPLTSLAISPGLLPMLGVSPVAGRQFTEADAARGAMPTVLIDYGLWQSHYGGAPDVVGRTILVDGRSTEIIGVLPAGFRLVTGRAVPRPFDVYQPLAVRDFRNFWAFPTIVRLRDGVTFDQANQRLVGLAAALVKQYPKDYSDARLQFNVHPLLDDMVNDTRPALRAALGAVMLLLLIAFANATALAVARLRTREHDLAVRSAIGAGRGALVMDVVVESAILSFAGALAATAMAVAATGGIRALVPHTVPRWQEVRVGWDLVAYSGALALAGLLVLGLIPVVKVSRGAFWQALRGGTLQGGRAEGATSRLVLAGGQIALTVVLAFGAVQLVRSARSLGEVNLGFDPDVLTVRVPVDFSTYNTPEKGARLYERVRDRVREVPGVTAVGAISHLPLSGSFLTDAYTPDLSKAAGWDDALANYYAVTPGYFASVGIPFRQGRDFTDLEDATGQHVVVVDETLARSAFPGVSNVIGRPLRLGYGIPDSTIIGVVGHVRGIEIGRDVRPQVYAPFGTFNFAPLNLTIRSTGDPTSLAAPIRAAIEEVRPGGALSGFTLLEGNVTAATSTLRAVTGLVMALAILAGLLSAVGLYTVIAFIVHQSRRSTAIRSALGASSGRLIRHHLRTSGAVMLVALPLGALAASAVAPFLAALVYGVAERDAVSLAVAALVAVVVSGLGTYLPARRAAMADTVSVLRGE